MSENFYKNVESIVNIKDLSREDKYQYMPISWSLVVTDIKNSTEAIKEGKYKDINLLGAMSIIGILNIDKSLDLPFVFGGDGSFLLIPNSLIPKAKQALLHMKKLAHDSYSLDLRVGIVPLRDIYTQKKEVKITRLLLPNEASQAIIKGGGLELADELLKNSQKYIINEEIDENFYLDLEGLECRWKQIESPKDKTLSIMLKCKDDKHYEEVFRNFERLIGSRHSRCPLNLKNLKLSFDSKELQSEATLISKDKKEKKSNIFKFKCINLIGSILMKLNIGQWGEYKDRIRDTLDSEKFDDLLRMVVCATNKQTNKLNEYLEEEYKKGNLVYGVHESNAALMTCLIFQRHGKHIHFIDSSNGGYALASKAYKKRSVKNSKI